MCHCAISNLVGCSNIVDIVYPLMCGCCSQGVGISVHWLYCVTAVFAMPETAYW